MDYRLINSKRHFKDATGYSKEKFMELVSDCEHAIGGMKIFRILKNKVRMKCKEMKNRILAVCAGLWNYKITP